MYCFSAVPRLPTWLVAFGALGIWADQDLSFQTGEKCPHSHCVLPQGKRSLALLLSPFVIEIPKELCCRW